jgi:Fumarylacetoacetase N-terminal domain 2
VKLATLRTAKLDGNLVVVSRDLARMIRADDSLRRYRLLWTHGRTWPRDLRNVPAA